MSFAECRLAVPKDDADLRRILRENPFDGGISLSFEREPNYFCAANVAGTFHQTMVVCETQIDQIMGMGDRSVRPLWVNGQVLNVGYFSGLRARERYRNGLALARFVQQGFGYYQQLHSDGRAPFYLISIIADNLPARRLLTAGLKNLPQLQEYTRMFTYAIHPSRNTLSWRPSRKHNLPLPGGLRLTRGTRDLIPAIVDCLNRNGARKQFFPYWTNDTLLSALTPDLMIEDFFLAVDGDRVAGCLALWDQNAFKQTVVRGYAGLLKRFRKTINLLSPLGGWPSLPEPGARLNQCYACFLAVDDDHPNIFAALLRAFYNEAARRRYAYFIIGLPEAHPLRHIVAAYRPIQYISQIYLATWQDGLDEVGKVDGRLPGLEIAIL